VRLPNGYRVARNHVPRSVVDAALRRVWLELRGCPVDPETIKQWDRSTWFPGIRNDPVFTQLLEHVRSHPLLSGAGMWCEPQLLVRLPDWGDQQGQPTWHVDELPPWAGRRDAYEAIVQVALTDCGPEQGGLVVRTFDGGPEPVHVSAGDIVIMHPDLPHAGTLNMGSTPRVCVYFRLLTRSLANPRRTSS